ncbi:MAG TPA: FecR domain-containing protein [Tenuifilaceae bacterium]|nr:FecR domain-containing protein [Tenuifilaceae bacterium]
MKKEELNMTEGWMEKFPFGELEVPSGIGKDAVWDSILASIKRENQHQKLNIFSHLSKIAAVFVALVVVGSLMWIFVFGSKEYYSPKGKHLQVQLPDGSRVELNADTRLSFNSALWRFKRNVVLDGEALFSVKKGDFFNVRTEHVTTQVLGTVFNVYSRNNEVKVSCIEGSVAVINTKTQQRVLLAPNQQTKLANGKLKEPDTAAKPEMATWTRGEFYFLNESLENVLKEIERQFNVNVNSMVAHERYYSGVFFNTNLEDALDLVCVPMNLSWKITSGLIVITEKESSN